MDLRKERTRRNIINAFIKLRSQKPLERITVKELSELALINKATFYSHYEDVYDLSRQLEDETIDSIIMNVSNLDNMIENTKQTTNELVTAFLSQTQLINILFSDSRNSVLSTRLEERFKEIIYEKHPEYNTLEWNIKLTMVLQGSYYAFAQNYKNYDVATISRIISETNERMLNN
ncbi:MAG: TetR/AcrR family transcriptional regulator [Saccharofermentans sp.]|nr:TetR/AcrR family transcriptional regulator [Saccharofermentans sp.]